MNTNYRARRLAVTMPLALLILLGGCSSEELYSQLTERQANEMVAILRSSGIDADKQIKDGQYSVLAPQSDFSQAVRTLSSLGYPRETFDSMGKIFKREGFVSSPLEERARLMHALSQEVSNTISNIDGVVTARVQLVVPEHNPLIDQPKRSAAAVFIKHRPDIDLLPQISQIKALVVNSVEGLTYDNVTVALFPAERWLPQAVAEEPDTPAARQAALSMPLLLGAAGGSIAFTGGGLLWWRRRSGPSTGAPSSSHELTGPSTQPVNAGVSGPMKATSRREPG